MAQSRTGLDLEQRLCLALHLTMDDIQERLHLLARDGRAGDCLAVMQELGDWMALGRGEMAPMLFVAGAFSGVPPSGVTKWNQLGQQP